MKRTIEAVEAKFGDARKLYIHYGNYFLDIGPDEFRILVATDVPKVAEIAADILWPHSKWCAMGYSRNYDTWINRLYGLFILDCAAAGADYKTVCKLNEHLEPLVNDGRPFFAWEKVQLDNFCRRHRIRTEEMIARDQAKELRRLHRSKRRKVVML